MKNLICLLLLLSQLSYSQEFFSSGKKILDYGGAFHIDTVALEVKGIANTINANYGLAKICFNIEHPRTSDLKIELLSPDGTSIWLTNRNGGETGVNYLNTCFRSNGFTGYIHEGKSPFIGEYIPDGRLSFINNGQNPNGIWKLLIQDLKQGETGIIHFAKLTFENNPMPNNDLGACNESNPALCQCKSQNKACDLLPDLVVLPKFTNDQIQEFSQNDPNYPGQLRFAATMANIGDGPMEVLGKGEFFANNKKVDSTVANARQRIYQRIYQKTADNKIIKKEIPAGTNYYDSKPGHNHFHVDDWVVFRLIKKDFDKKGKLSAKKILSESAKVSYCLWDTGICNSVDSLCFVNKKFYGSNNLPNYGLGTFNNCSSGVQGISVGGYDTYGMFYEGQYLTIPKNTKNGRYFLEIELDPYKRYRETNKNNNVFTKEIYLTKQF
jgi:subtilisin-like proprotein convertase family protein